MKNIELLCDSHHGQYLPSIWCNNTENIWGITQEYWDYIADESHLDDETYWDIWHGILSNAAYTDSKGITWILHQDGDLFAVAYDEMTEEDKEIFWR